MWILRADDRCITAQTLRTGGTWSQSCRMPSEEAKGGIRHRLSKPTNGCTSDAAARRKRGEGNALGSRSRLCIGDDGKSHVAIGEIVIVFLFTDKFRAARACKRTDDLPVSQRHVIGISRAPVVDGSTRRATAAGSSMRGPRASPESADPSGAAGSGQHGATRRHQLTPRTAVFAMIHGLRHSRLARSPMFCVIFYLPFSITDFFLR